MVINGLLTCIHCQYWTNPSVLPMSANIVHVFDEFIWATKPSLLDTDGMHFHDPRQSQNATPAEMICCFFSNQSFGAWGASLSEKLHLFALSYLSFNFVEGLVQEQGPILGCSHPVHPQIFTINHRQVLSSNVLATASNRDSLP